VDAIVYARPGIGDVADKVLQNPLVYDRIGIKNVADAFQFRSMRMIHAGDHEGHLFLIHFAHFVGASFVVFVVILVACTPFITTLQRICLPQNALFFDLFQIIEHSWMDTN